MANTTAISSLSVVSYAYSTLFNEHDQYLMGLGAGPSSFSSNTLHPT